MSTTNIISYNQLIQMFEDFATAHLQINSFGVGPTSEIGTSNQINYPLLWITHRTTSDIVVTNKTQIPQLTLTFIIVDQINNQSNYLNINGINSDNQQEVLSDTLQISQDLVNYISTQMGQFGVKLMENNISIEPIFDELEDKVSGWIMDVNLQLKHSNCITPIGDITFTVPGTSNISLRYLTCNTLTGCSTFNTIINNLEDQIEAISASTGNLIAINGLTKSGNTITLGGSLTGNTLISDYTGSSNFDISLSSGNISLVSDAGNVSLTTNAYNTITLNGTGGTEIYDQVNIDIESEAILLEATDNININAIQDLNIHSLIDLRLISNQNITLSATSIFLSETLTEDNTLTKVLGRDNLGELVEVNLNELSSLSATSISASTLYVENELWTIELVDLQTVDFYAPYNMAIDSIDNVFNSPSIALFDDDVVYTLTNPIAKGSKITVSADTASVINLNCSR